jgi:hypothetical protein
MRTSGTEVKAYSLLLWFVYMVRIQKSHSIPNRMQNINASSYSRNHTIRKCLEYMDSTEIKMQNKL